MSDTEKTALVAAGRKAFARCKSGDEKNRVRYLEDTRFARAGEQWPDHIVAQREEEGRPMLTINKLPAFIRQVVNDARQNKPSIRVRPADNDADVETADVMSGLIRNIEHISNAAAAYDTAAETAVSGNVGYIRVNIDYTHDDNFDLDLLIERVKNPLAVFPDPNAQSVDGSDWNVCFIVDKMSKEEFKETYPDATETDFDSDAYAEAKTDWCEDDQIMVAEWWERKEVDREIVLLSTGAVLDKKELESDDELQFAMDAGEVEVVKTKTAKSYEVTRRIMSGAEILDEQKWPGKYIPIAVVYGDEVDIEGERHLFSLIHPAKDAQAMHNYWRTTSTELVALAPKVPFIGAVGAFDEDPNWATANSKSHPFLEYTPVESAAPPQRQPLDGGVAAGALQEALNAADDMKAIMGLHDASLGARSNETSGKAIMARQREGDVSTFHFLDNLSRAIRHVGVILLDLMPHVYSGERMVRVLGEDGTEENKQLGKPHPKEQPKMDNGQPVKDPVTGQPVMEPVMRPAINPETGQPAINPQTQQPYMEQIIAMHDLAKGKYDLIVDVGPSFTSRREEAAYGMQEFMRAMGPNMVPLIAADYLEMQDWPGADKMADRLRASLPKPQEGPDPRVQQLMQQVEQKVGQLNQKLGAVTQENASLKLQLQNKQGALVVEQQEADTKQFAAETDRMEAMQSPIYP